MKRVGQKTKTQPARTGYDRLVGPMRLVPFVQMWLLNPDERVPLTGQWALAPDVSGSAWRIEGVERGREGSEVLYRRIAALEEADEERMRAEVSRIGALGPSGAATDEARAKKLLSIAALEKADERIRAEVSRIGALGPSGAATDEARAKELLARLQARLKEGPRPEPTTPLVTYPADHDPRVFRRTSESTIEMVRDGGATRDIADAVEHYLENFEFPAPDHAAVAAVARAVAKGWRPALGCARLYELAREELMARGQRAPDVTWPRVVALVLIARSAVRPLVAWRGLAMITPLLLAIVGPQYRDEEPRRTEKEWSVEGASCPWPRHELHEKVRSEPVASWLELAREARAWRDVLDELRKGGLGRRAGGVEQMKTAFEALAGVLFGVLNDIRPDFERVDAHDSATLWQKFAQLYDQRFETAGLTSVPAGALLGTRAHALLAMQRAFRASELCRLCGARREIDGLCRPCYREFDRDRHKRRRAQKSPAGAGRPGRQVGGSGRVRRTAPPPRKRRLPRKS